jgi:hypothetical protein
VLNRAEPSARKRAGDIMNASALVVVVGFCLLLIANDLYYGEYAIGIFISLLVVVPMTLGWLVWFVVSWKSFSRGSVHLWWFIAAPVVLGLTFTLLHFHVPKWAGWHISKASFEAAAAELGKDPGKAEHFQRRIGVYDVRDASVDPESGAVYFLTTHGFLDHAAFVLLPNGAQAHIGYVGRCHPLDGDWKVCTDDKD